MRNIPTLFRKDAKGLAIPMITDGCEWVLGSDNGIMTIKLDGIGVRIYFQEKDGWVIEKTGGDDVWIKTSREGSPHIWKAFDNLDVKNTGIYEVYGVGINGNPHKIGDTYMLKIIPADYTLIVPKGTTKVLRGPTQTVKMLYDNIKAELVESPEIEGFVFHKEGSGMTLEAICKVRKSDFGIPWPAQHVDLLPAGPIEINAIPTV